MWRDTFKFHPLLRSSDCPDISRSEALPKILRAGNTVTDHLNVTRVGLAHPGDLTPGRPANGDPRYAVLRDALRLGRH
jgi:hypothetical protein